MTTRLYRSTDGGAPSLTGAAGAGISLLDAVLVNGYNSKTVTITRSGSTATATCVGHGFPNDGVTRITISGAGQAEYNVETYITNVTTDTFDYTVTGAPATPATGTINAIVTPAGWTKGYTGTNLATYKNATSVTGTLHQRQLRVDDTNAQYMIICGYETMTDVNTGIGPMPTPALAPVTGGAYWLKSAAANATVRPWAIIASDTFFLLYVDGSGTSFGAPVNGAHMHAYGDFVTFSTVDLYNTILCGGTGITTATAGFMWASSGPSYQTNFNGHWVQRGSNGYGSSRAITKSSLCGITSSAGTLGAGYGPSTNVQNYFSFGHVYVQENNPDGFVLRGKFPGIMDPTSVYTTWTPGDILIPQSGTATGRKFIFFKTTISGNTLTSGIMVDFSDNWDIE